MSENARSMLHEVMEQQIVSIAKAGIIASLNARTSVLACANPIGSRYNPRVSVIDNIHLPPTLLSRFDLIYLMLDKADEQTDRRLAKHIVALHFVASTNELTEMNFWRSEPPYFCNHVRSYPLCQVSQPADKYMRFCYTF